MSFEKTPGTTRSSRRVHSPDYQPAPDCTKIASRCGPLCTGKLLNIRNLDNPFTLQPTVTQRGRWQKMRDTSLCTAGQAYPGGQPATADDAHWSSNTSEKSLLFCLDQVDLFDVLGREPSLAGGAITMPLCLPLSQTLLAEHMHASCDQYTFAPYITETAADHRPQRFQFLLL